PSACRVYLRARLSDDSHAARDAAVLAPVGDDRGGRLPLTGSQRGDGPDPAEDDRVEGLGSEAVAALGPRERPGRPGVPGDHAPGPALQGLPEPARDLQEDPRLPPARSPTGVRQRVLRAHRRLARSKGPSRPDTRASGSN